MPVMVKTSHRARNTGAITRKRIKEIRLLGAPKEARRRA